MKIGVTYENGKIFQHFGHTEEFKFYDVENNEIKHEQTVNTNGQGHGALAAFLAQNNIEILICGGIGGGAKVALAEAGIKVYGGVTGNADEAVRKFITGNLEFNPDIYCVHHQNSCGEHHCDEDKHGCKGNEKTRY